MHPCINNGQVKTLTCPFLCFSLSWLKNWNLLHNVIKYDKLGKCIHTDTDEYIKSLKGDNLPLISIIFVSEIRGSTCLRP